MVSQRVRHDRATLLHFTSKRGNSAMCHEEIMNINRVWDRARAAKKKKEK